MKHLAIFTLIFTSSVFSQEIDLKKIMNGNEFIGYQPQYQFWSHDSKTVFFDWRKEGDIDYKAYQFKAGEIDVLPFEEYADNMMEGYKTHKGKGLFVSKGRLYMFDVQSGEKRELMYSNKIRDYYFTDNEEEIIVNIGKDFFRINLKSFKMTKIAEFGKFPKEKEEDENSFLEAQQEELFEVVRSRKEKSEYRKEKNEKSFKKEYAEINILKGYWVNTELSLNLNTLAYVHVIEPKTKETDYFHFITSDGVAEARPARTKVGRADPEVFLHIYDLVNKIDVEFDPKDLSGIYNRPLYLNEYEKDEFKEKSEEPKDVIYHNIQFSADSKKILFEVKSFDNKDRWVVVYTIKDKSFVEVDHQHDEAWIGGPGIIGWTTEGGNIGWFQDSDRVYFQSEKSGYSHLYVHSLKSKKTNQLTEGDFEIHNAILSNDNTKFYVTANKSNPGNRDFHHLDAKSGKWTTILSTEGNYEVVVSPDEKKLAYRFSQKNKPWELYVMDNVSGADFVQITNSTTKEFDEITWIAPEVIHFKAADGVEVPARIYQPETTVSKGKAVIFVHGAGYLQNAHNWWSAYYHEYMFHNLLVQKGYTVLDIDYRASEGYGRDWRTSIYRHMGSKDVSDQLDGRKYLIEEIGIAEDKIGIYGGSYGGFVTMMALLTEPGKFQCGAAIRSVTDWAHYNHPYTSNILNTPETDSIAYVRSSPIYFAENLQDELLILHGMLDDNVQFQDVVRLTQRFIELGKDQFEMAVYPVEPHGFKIASSWYDEYKRILKLFEENL